MSLQYSLMTCGYCKGNGEIVRIEDDPDANHELITEMCPTCDGEGFVILETDVEDAPSYAY